jgi:poly-gamma-glutamate synthesis protein (capsule biosynthesis protein)
VSGRPGLNPLRFTTVYSIRKSEFDQFAKISKTLGLPEAENGKLNFLEHIFAVGDKADIHTTPHKPDFDGNLRAIVEARRNADFVFVSIHNHEKRRPGEQYFDDQIEYIAKFVETFSRAAIDAGADAILGHGTHCLNGIEIYKGHPKYYGLGNFISQSYQGNPKPYDWFEARGLHEKTYLDESEETEHPSGTTEERRIRRLTSSAVAKIIFKNRKPIQIMLYPIELLKQQVQGGRPLLASGASANEILNRLYRLSADYGTKIIIENGIGRILLSE